MDASVTTTLWRFVRGDLPVASFEAWLYAQKDLERDLGEELYMELLSFDYRDRRELVLLCEKLATFLRPALECECVTLPDMAMVPMGCEGVDERVFASVQRTANHGSEKWWLSLNRCRVCGQDWMIAQEERIYDDYFLRRLTAHEARAITDDARWPDDFSTYEKVLELGSRLSKAYRFLDDLSPTLIDSARDLKRTRPTISIEEIAKLLGVDVAHARMLLSAV
jgi:hypothetical protein